MGWSNSIHIFHKDVTYILQPDIPEIVTPTSTMYLARGQSLITAIARATMRQPMIVNYSESMESNVDPESAAVNASGECK